MVSRDGLAAEIVVLKEIIASLSARVAVLEERLASEASEFVPGSPPKFSRPKTVSFRYGSKARVPVLEADLVFPDQGDW